MLSAEHLQSYLAGAEVTLSDDVLDQIDAIVEPGTDVMPLESAAYVPPTIENVTLRRRPVGKPRRGDRVCSGNASSVGVGGSRVLSDIEQRATLQLFITLK